MNEQRVLPSHREATRKWYEESCSTTPEMSVQNYGDKLLYMSLTLDRMLPPVVREHVYADHFDSPAICKGTTVVPPRHGPLRIVVDELAKDAGQRLVRDPAQIHTAFCVSFPDEHSAVTGTQGDHVSGTSEIVCGDGGGCEGPNC